MIDKNKTEFDKLDEMMKKQMELDRGIAIKHKDKMPKSVSEWVIKNTIAMESEIDEIRREINWKYWKPEKEIDHDKLQEEVIDLWHFLLQLSYKVGMNTDDIYNIYMGKNKENENRQAGKSKEGQAYDYREGDK